MVQQNISYFHLFYLFIFLFPNEYWYVILNIVLIILTIEWFLRADSSLFNYLYLQSFFNMAIVIKIIR